MDYLKCNKNMICYIKTAKEENVVKTNLCPTYMQHITQQEMSVSSSLRHITKLFLIANVKSNLINKNTCRNS